MFGGYWYIDGADGRRYCYAKEPTYRCHVGAIERDPVAPDAGYVLTPAIVAAADKLEIDAQFLARKLRHSPERSRVNGKLTDDCNACGHRMERVGFRYWIEVVDTESRTPSTQLTQMMGGTPTKTVEGPWFAKTKQAAKQWAGMRVKQTKAAA